MTTNREHKNTEDIKNTFMLMIISHVYSIKWVAESTSDIQVKIKQFIISQAVNRQLVSIGYSASCCFPHT